MKRPKALAVATVLLVLLLTVEVFVVKKAANYEPKIKVVYAKERIPAEEVITRDMLVEKEVALSLVNMKAIKDMGEAVGKVAKFDIEKMEMITANRIIDRIEERKIELLDAGNRLVTVKFEPDQVNGWWINDRVDILFIPNETSKYEPKPKISNGQQEERDGYIYDSSTVVRLENIRVAAIIDESRQLVEDVEDMTYMPVMVSFEVDTEQDKFLAWAKYHGKIEVSVRGE